MNKAPRASLSITVLDDEDYRVLMASRGGAEAFGIFVAMIIVGRERLQQGQARQVSGTESLRCDNSTTHLLAMTHVTPKQFDKTLATLAEVARETGSAPWMHLDESKHLVIRSFFKFNTCTAWGGQRPGAGRKSRRNQDDCENNQDDSDKESSRIVSYASPASDSDSDSDSLPMHAVAAGGAAPGSVGSSTGEAVELTRSLFGDGHAESVTANAASIDDRTGGRWDCFSAALRRIDFERRRPNAKPVGDLIGLGITIAKKYAANGIPPDPLPVEPRASPSGRPTIAENRAAAAAAGFMEKLRAKDAERGFNRG